MKRLLLLLTCVLTLFGVSKAEEKELTIDWSEYNWNGSLEESTQVGAPLLNSVFNLTIKQESGSNPPFYSTSGKDLRLYNAQNSQGGSITFSAISENVKITAIGFTFNGNGYAFSNTAASIGSLNISSSVGSWTYSTGTSNVTFRNNTTHQVRISKVIIYYEDSSAPKTPVTMAFNMTEASIQINQPVPNLNLTITEDGTDVTSTLSSSVVYTKTGDDIITISEDGNSFTLLNTSGGSASLTATLVNDNYQADPVTFNYQVVDPNQPITIELTTSILGKTGSGYVTTAWTFSTDDGTFGINNIIPNTAQARGNQADPSSNFYIYNTTPIPNIKAVKLYPKNSGTIKNTNNETDAVYLMVGNNAITSTSTTNGTKGIVDSNNTNVTFTSPSSGNSYFRIQFLNNSTSGSCTLSKIEIITEEPDSGTSAVSKPQISCENNLVTITCATDGAQIYYTTDGSDPTNESTPYSNPFSIDKTTTVKAIAYSGDDTSAVATFTANYIGVYDSFKAFMDTKPANNTQFVVSGNITIVYQSGQYLYAVDSENYPMLIYGTQSAIYTNGQQFGSISGTYSVYNDLPEITNATLGTAVSGTNPISPAVTFLTDITSDIINKYIEVKNVQITAENPNTYLTDGSTKIQLYNSFDVEIPSDEKVYNVIGLVSIYNSTIQVYPISFDVVVGADQVATPTFSPAGGAVSKGATVTIATEPEDATIYYTTDGTDPTTASTQYTKPIEITTDVTIKAFAVKAQMTDSYIQEASFTVIDLTKTEATFNFTDPASLTTVPDIEFNPESTEKINLNGVTMSESVINIDVTCPANTASSSIPCLYYGTGNNSGWALRIYNNSEITISAIEGCYITSIEFTGSTLINGVTYSTTGTRSGSATSSTWTPNNKIGVNSMTIKRTASGNTQFNTITVHYAYYDPNVVYLVGTMTNDKTNNPSYQFQEGKDEEGNTIYTLSVGSISNNDTFYVQKGLTSFYVENEADQTLNNDTMDGQITRTLYSGTDNEYEMQFKTAMRNVVFTLTPQADKPSEMYLEVDGEIDNDSSWIVTFGNDKTNQSGKFENNTYTIETVSDGALIYVYPPTGATGVVFAVSPSETYKKASKETNGSAYVIPLSIGEGTVVCRYLDTNGEENTSNICTIKYVVKRGDPTAVEAIGAEDEGEAEYYTLQGVKVQNPDKGIFIKVANGKATKVVK